MSKEAMGQNGALLGSSSYWERVNRATFLGGLMRQSGNWGYWETLREVADRASSATEEIHQDLQEKADSLRSLSDSRRNSLEKLARGLYDVCRMSGGTASRADNCISLLRAAGAFQGGFSSGSPAAVAAVKKMKNDSRFFTSECVELVEKAADWGISFAAGSDKRKRDFLEDVAQGRGKPFFQEVLETYKSTAKPADLRGRCGYEIGSSDYLARMERSVFGQDLPAQSSIRWGSPGYTALLRDSLEHISREVERDLEYNLRENNYITDATAGELKSAAKELARCGVSGMLDGKIEKLTWFVGGDPAKIRQLQSKLNELGVGEHLTEDGVYGKKTLAAWESFLNNLAHGTIPTLNWIDPLKNTKDVLEIGSSFDGHNNVIQSVNIMDTVRRRDVDCLQNRQYFRIDPPHQRTNGTYIWGNYRGDPRRIDYNHVNIDFPDSPTTLQQWVQTQYNHYPLSDGAYAATKDLKATGKVIRVAGKVLLVAGVALDAVELGTAIDTDLHDADQKLGRKTISTAASIGGRWAGAALGAKLGAVAGAATGPLAPIAIPVLGLVGGIGGSFAGDALGRWVVDITDVED